MQITITGPRAGGSTTIAALIAQVLREKGMIVRFQSRSETSTKFLEGYSTTLLEGFSRPSTVTIVEGMELEDEHCVKRCSDAVPDP